MSEAESLFSVAERIDPVAAARSRARLAAKHGDERALATAVLLATAFPVSAGPLEAGAAPPRLDDPAGTTPADVRALIGSTDADELRRELRRLARLARWRIAVLEVVPRPLGGYGIEQAARALSELADATIEVALAEACRTVFARFGRPGGDDHPGQLTVLGMGKLGGRELNAGSDVDLVCFYDSDEHVAVGPAGASTSAHEVWTRVVRRMTANLEDVTDDGLVWRVDLRLRPEGSQGALVNSLAAAERYYESFGRLWERAALLRARPVAGDRAFGKRVLAALEPFVWKRRVEPHLAEPMVQLVVRAERELCRAPERDLKLGPGGIRAAETFVQTLQLIWGGRSERLRARSMSVALDRLRGAGYVTDREADDLYAAYWTLRRAEHAVQNRTGAQTHELPAEAGERERVARMLGFADVAAMDAAIGTHRRRIAELLAGLLPSDEPESSRWSEVARALDEEDLGAFEAALQRQIEVEAASQKRLASDLHALSRHPDAPLGVRSREQKPAALGAVLDGVAEAADPVQAAFFLRGFFAKVPLPALYTKTLASDPLAARRLCAVLGASAFVGDAVSSRPELCDLVLFEAAVPTPRMARREVREAVRAPPSPADDPVEHQVGQMRRAKSRVAVQVALADMAGMLTTRRATRVLSAVADATLEAATRIALDGEPDAPARGLAVIAMGKLGGREIGYGSDLDVMFLFDPAAAPADPVAYFTRRAQRVIRFISMPHQEGRGYELDTRLRPSGSQGLLVVSLDAFARYHEVGSRRHDPSPHAATWERLALLRARAAAGDAALGERAMAIARAAAYERPVDAGAVARDVRHLRERMERELARERPGRYDLKHGHGGLLDIELTVQMLQLIYGADARVRTTETRLAIDRLEAVGAMTPVQAETLREGYDYLRKLEQRIRVVHADSSHLIEDSAAGLPALARRMGISPLPHVSAATRLMDEYRLVTSRVRAVYTELVESAATPG